ncbi:MAG: EscU/YscU/HrcU family type III secretion system export apparatus switch protein [Bryobacterales bacterium]|nr:EscU/YscU/HrcU family type III secretion system export apparatus switch protein [Bryobacteraceae bacterium]MDW8355257.1 EscU/YscU/HrcU family type III secretion system export apparatus switch protein [Bryobacterales bacterium]
MPDRGQKTEPPTPRKIERARREGQFVVSREFVGALHFLAFVIVVTAWSAGWLAETAEACRWVLRKAFRAELGLRETERLLAGLIRRSLVPLAATGVIVAGAALLAHLTITRFGFSWKRLAPDAQRLAIRPRLEELFRNNVAGLFKAVLLLPIFAWVVYYTAKENLAAFLMLPLAAIPAGVRIVAASIADLLWKTAAVLLVLGVVDLARQRRRYLENLKMSRQELRDEIRELEGHPQVRLRIRRLMRERLRRRMLREVPKATAVVVNPTHYAVALRYSMETMRAPVVVAKGKNWLARKIRELAVAYEVPVIENPPLARALYEAAEVGQEIPSHLYRAVAEILAYVYRLLNGRLPG